MVAIIKRIVPNSKKKTIFAGIAVIILLSFFILELVVVRRSAVKNRFGDEIAHVVTDTCLLIEKKYTRKHKTITNRLCMYLRAQQKN